MAGSPVTTLRTALALVSFLIAIVSPPIPSRLFAVAVVVAVVWALAELAVWRWRQGADRREQARARAWAERRLAADEAAGLLRRPGSVA